MLSQVLRLMFYDAKRTSLTGSSRFRRIHGELACTGRRAERHARRLKMGVEIDVLGDESPGWKDELTHQSCNRLAL